MARTIVVPLDGSAFAEHALPHALAHAEPGARMLLILVHRTLELRDAVATRGHSDDWQTSLKRQEEDYLAEIARRLRDAGHDVSVSLMDGDVAASIAACARHERADLITLTTHARGGLERAWIGSVALGVIRAATAPVLVVRPDSTTRDALQPAPPPRTILVAWDDSIEARRALELARSTARSTGAELIIARVVTPYTGPTSPYLPHAVQMDRAMLDRRTEAAQRELADLAADLPLTGREVAARTIIAVDTSPARGILDLAAEHAADLIVMGTHGRGAAARIVLGSVSDKVVRAAEVPVLLCRKPTT